MNADAFERFETSRSGLLIPLAVFVVGAIATVVAITTVNQLALREAAMELEIARQADRVIVAAEVTTATAGESQPSAGPTTQNQGQATP